MNERLCTSHISFLNLPAVNSANIFTGLQLLCLQHFNPRRWPRRCELGYSVVLPSAVPLPLSLCGMIFHPATLPVPYHSEDIIKGRKGGNCILLCIILFSISIMLRLQPDNDGGEAGAPGTASGADEVLITKSESGSFSLLPLNKGNYRHIPTKCFPF